jgi:hypothetical protein
MTLDTADMSRQKMVRQQLITTTQPTNALKQSEQGVSNETSRHDRNA